MNVIVIPGVNDDFLGTHTIPTSLSPVTLVTIDILPMASLNICLSVYVPTYVYLSSLLITSAWLPNLHSISKWKSNRNLTVNTLR